MPKVGKKDPHMKSPLPKFFLIVAIIAALVYFVVPKVIEIYNDNLDEMNERNND